MYFIFPLDLEPTVIMRIRFFLTLNTKFQINFMCNLIAVCKVSGKHNLNPVRVCTPAVHGGK